MVEHVWTVLCTKSTIDSESNNISLVEVLEQLSVGDPGGPKEGIVPLPVELVTLWSRKNYDQPVAGRGRTSFVRPSGVIPESIQEHPIDLRVSKRLRHRQKFAGIPVREAGLHLFRVELFDEATAQWLLVASIPLEILFEPLTPATR